MIGSMSLVLGGFQFSYMYWVVRSAEEQPSASSAGNASGTAKVAPSSESSPTRVLVSEDRVNSAYT